MFRNIRSLIAALCVIAAPAQAATLVDTGTPPPSNTTWTLSPSQSLAAEFTLSAASVIDSIMGHIRGSGNSTITIGLFTDGGEIPGMQLFAGTFASTSGTSFQGLTGLSWAVGAGTYWVTFASTGFDGMSQNAPSPLGNEAFAPAGSGFIENDGLNLGVRITGNAGTGAVPEPGTWVMLILGFGLLGGVARRQRVALFAHA